CFGPKADKAELKFRGARSRRSWANGRWDENGSDAKKKPRPFRAGLKIHRNQVIFSLSLLANIVHSIAWRKFGGTATSTRSVFHPIPWRKLRRAPGTFCGPPAVPHLIARRELGRTSCITGIAAFRGRISASRRRKKKSSGK